MVNLMLCSLPQLKRKSYSGHFDDSQVLETGTNRLRLWSMSSLLLFPLCSTSLTPLVFYHVKARLLHKGKVQNNFLTFLILYFHLLQIEKLKQQLNETKEKAQEEKEKLVNICVH